MGSEEREQPSEFVESASAAGGAIAGVAATFVAGPFAGSASGALVARALRAVGSEIERRILAPRQARRIEEATQAAGEGIRERLQRGEEAREDRFFEADDDGDSRAEEFLEGVLRTAADAWERRKVPYIGRLFSGMSFDASVNIAEGSYLLRLSDRLTYRQLALLAFWQAAQDDHDYEQAVINLGIDQDTQGGRPTASLAAEMDDLMRAGLLGVARDDGSVGSPEPTWDGIADAGTFKGTDLVRVRLTELGQTLHRLMGLGGISSADLDQVLRAVQGQSA